MSETLLPADSSDGAFQCACHGHLSVCLELGHVEDHIAVHYVPVELVEVAAFAMEDVGRVAAVILDTEVRECARRQFVKQTAGAKVECDFVPRVQYSSRFFGTERIHARDVQAQVARSHIRTRMATIERSQTKGSTLLRQLVHPRRLDGRVAKADKRRIARRDDDVVQNNAYDGRVSQHSLEICAALQRTSLRNEVDEGKDCLAALYPFAQRIPLSGTVMGQVQAHFPEQFPHHSVDRIRLSR